MLTFPILLVLMLFAAPPNEPWNGNAPVSDATTKIPELQDDAWGECPAFSHYHPSVAEFLDDHIGPKDFMLGAELDGLCHRDDDDTPIADHKVLPNPKDKWL